MTRLEYRQTKNNNIISDHINTGFQRKDTAKTKS